MPTPAGDGQRTIYKVRRLEKKSRRRKNRVLTTLTILVLALAAFAGYEVWRAPNVRAMSPSPDGFVAERSLTARLTVKGFAGLKNVAITLDGHDVTTEVHSDGDHLSFATGRLADGQHTVAFSAESGNIFRSHLARTWRFTVDTTVPKVDLGTLEAKPVVASAPAEFSGTTEPFATVTVTDGTIRAGTTADAGGAYVVRAALPEGLAGVTFSVRDRAGNESKQRLTLLVDGTPPKLDVATIAATLRTTKVAIAISATDAAAPPKVTARLNGHALKVKLVAGAARILLKDMPQGDGSLVVSAIDKGGHRVTSTQHFLVDSTEKFGDFTMRSGAIGADVTALQTLLAKSGVYKGATTGVYDAATIAAVKKLQAKYQVTVDGNVGETTLVVLSGHILIDLSKLRLFLYHGSRLVKSYPIAAGQPAWPTPTGTYRIVTMIKDPTWLPPNSDWAKNATKIPPGTANPLGTRWMGTSASGVGMHGVPPSEDGTIGTYASHGCLRMHNWDAIDLFGRVAIGMPVIIQW